jgi:hypothetical protein
MYFSKLPKVSYNYRDSEYNIQKKLAVDITSRVKVAEYISLYKNNFNKYTIRDEERPDTLAHKLYDRSDLHWVFYIVNNMINPYDSWPRSTVELNSHIDEKYSGTSIFVPDIWFSRLDLDENYEYSVAYTDVGKINDFSSGFEKNAIPNKSLLKINEKTSIKVHINGVMYNTKIKNIRPEFYEVRIETKEWGFNPSLTNAFLFYEIENFGSKITIRVPITRIIQHGRYSINNFHVNGEYRDPAQSFEAGSRPYGEGPFGPYGYFVHPPIDDFISDGYFGNIQKPSFAYYYAIKDEDGAYLNADYYETNELYESKANESKRKILVPKPTLVQQVVNSLDQIFKNSGDRTQ